MSLRGKICLVTGATRGIGRGIALQLGLAGATVYVTGRTLQKKPDSVGSSLEEVAHEIDKRGGICVPMQCDHSNDDQVKQVFDTIKDKENGRLDVLVNNAYGGVDVNEIVSNANTNKFRWQFWKDIYDLLNEPLMVSNRGKFYELEPNLWDEINGVGLRNHYFCTVYAARMMAERENGLIVTISSGGGLKYTFNIPYGVGKEACDRMMADCAVELKRKNVACISLWPGPVFTEATDERVKNDTNMDESTRTLFQNAESTEFPGICIAKLAADPNIMKKSGRILLTSDLGDEYKVKDINGQKVASLRSLSNFLKLSGWKTTSSLVPEFIKTPHFVMHLTGMKF